MDDIRCRLLVENLPNLTFLSLSKPDCETDDNKLSDRALVYIVRLLQLAELDIGTRVIHLGKNRISDEGVGLLVQLPLLKLHISSLSWYLRSHQHQSKGTPESLQSTPTYRTGNQYMGIH